MQLQFVDAALGQFQAELEQEHLASSTLIIVSAKHGQSPIDPADRKAISDAPIHSAPGFGKNGFDICDDAELVWLSPELQQAYNPATGHLYYDDAKAYLVAHAAELQIAQLLDRHSLKPLYHDPLKNSRVPDFIAVTNHGVICTGGTKLAEHGGFSDDDRHVLLLLSSPSLHQQYVETASYTTQIAPTILYAIGMNPTQLEGVRKEGTTVLTH